MPPQSSEWPTRASQAKCFPCRTGGRTRRKSLTCVPPPADLQYPHLEFLQVDTRNILFGCGGAFAGLEKIIQARSTSTGIGFSADIRSPQARRNVGQVLSVVEPEDLIKFGLIPEFVGRLPVVATLEELDESALLRILSEPKNALVKQFKRLFEMEGVDLEFRPAALAA